MGGGQVRGLAGKKQTHLDTLRTLRLKKVNAARLVPNTASVRGALDKVKHLVRIESEEAYRARAAAALAKAAPRPTLLRRHPPPA